MLIKFEIISSTACMNLNVFSGYRLLPIYNCDSTQTFVADFSGALILKNKNLLFKVCYYAIGTPKLFKPSV